MQEPEKVNSADDKLTVALRRLRPAAINHSARDVWYQAGYRSGRRSVNLWRTTAAALVLGMIAAATWEHRQGSTTPVPSSGWAVDHVRAHSGLVTNPVATDSAITVPAVTTAGSAYARLRDSLIWEGLGGLEGCELPGGNPSAPPGERGGPDEGSDVLNFYHTNIRG